MNAISKGLDEKFCSECAAVIKSKAVICLKCGCPQVGEAVSQSAGQQKIKNTAGILALLLGGIGVHKFYLGQPKQGLLRLVFFWTWIPALIGIVDAIKLFGMTVDDFNRTYNGAE